MKKSALFRDSFWALFGNAIGKGFALIAGILVARLLGKEVYGEYSIIKSTLLMIAIFSSFGLGITATKFIAEVRERDINKIREIEKFCNLVTLVMSAFIAFIVSLFASQIAIIIKAPHLEQVLRWSSIAIVLNAINTTQQGVLGGFKAYKTAAYNSIITGIVTFLVTIPLTLYFHFIGAVIALMISLLFNCCINRYSIKKLLPINSSSQIGDLRKDIIQFSFPIALQESLYSITSWLASFVIIRLAGYGELGICNAASQWQMVMIFVPGALRNVALSHLSTTNNTIDDNGRVLIRLIKINFISTMLPCIAIWLFSGIICKFYGEQFQSMRPVLNIFALTAVFNSISNIITQELIALNRNWFLFFTRLIRDFGMVLFTFILLKSIQGGAFTYACVGLTFNVMYLILLLVKYKSSVNSMSCS